ncbi:putative pollen-specific leucine-rich repeat extensin-like protein 3 [Iris pallida]|uniref:Pollen-specific leucine-rich repeat extensin-like protein 3 n=1 Tax=Iris pallida TaxID=29817 RepID=A0AAX6FHJ7_IRIPA|nr:putative pollen-specific leucine-rich repeat extensin-like protein 3 [Iris pallida]
MCDGIRWTWTHRSGHGGSVVVIICGRGSVAVAEEMVNNRGWPWMAVQPPRVVKIVRLTFPAMEGVVCFDVGK